MKYRLIKNEKGSVLPLVALFLFFVAFGVIALVVDVGTLYETRKAMVTAADAGALAGAGIMEKSLGVSDLTEINAIKTEAIRIAKSLALTNGAEGEPIVEFKKMKIEGTLSYRDVIVVTVTKNEIHDFAKMIGVDDSDVKAQAAGTWGYSKQVTGGQIFPLFMLEEAYLASETELHDGKVLFNETVSDPNRGFIKLGDDVTGKQIIKETLSGENMDEVFILNEILVSETGQVTAIENSIEKRMTDAISYKNNEGETIFRSEAERKQYMSGLIPIVTKEDTGSNSHVDLRIKYFAVYTIYDVIISAQNKKPSTGSTKGFTDPGFVSDNIASTYDEKFQKTTIIGQYTGERIELTSIIKDGDQELEDNTENLEGLATYSKLVN